MIKCSCPMLLVCHNCKNAICEVHSTTVIRVAVIYAGCEHPEHLNARDDNYYFCSGACLFRWNLEQAHEHLEFYGAIDATWLPVIKQLEIQIQTSITKSMEYQRRKEANKDNPNKGGDLTYESIDIVVTMLNNNGVYPGDPPMDSIYEYKSIPAGRVMFAVFSEPRHFDLDVSPYVADYKLLWSRREGLTLEGKKFLQKGIH